MLANRTLKTRSEPLELVRARELGGVASLLDLRQCSSFEGQAAMDLEFAADPGELGAYPMPLLPGTPMLLDWEPLVRALLADRASGLPVSVIAARVWRGFARAIVRVAEVVGIETVALGGGCFQNRLLTEWSAGALQQAGLRVLLHSRTPPNDGCIALGQVAVAAATLRQNETR